MHCIAGDATYLSVSLCVNDFFEPDEAWVTQEGTKTNPGVAFDFLNPFDACTVAMRKAFPANGDLSATKDDWGSKCHTELLKLSEN